MKEANVRLIGISICNFKNVRQGNVSFLNRRKKYQSSVLGVYGQNGSGKTALIDAIELLKLSLTGRKVPERFADYVYVGSESAYLRYTLMIRVDKGKYSGDYQVEYAVGLKKEKAPKEENLEDNDALQEIGYRAVLFDEELKFSFCNDHIRIKKCTLMNTTTESVFNPHTKYEAIFGKDEKLERKLLIAKGMATRLSQSFLFSGDLIESFKEQVRERLDDQMLMIYWQLFDNLLYYAHYELFVIQTNNSGIISMNFLPLAFRYEENHHGAAGRLAVPIDAPAVVPEDEAHVIDAVVNSMNIVLCQLVPGLTIQVQKLGLHLMKNGNKGLQIQLISRRNGRDIPLKYESEGIKKIISVLQLLIVVYNRSAITVAIDELDSGIFEYLLGELLRIISEKGKGQLIFTSHNLRPLETIDRGFIAFTTTNPDSRYIRLAHVKENNNLRDFYFRDIVLGEQDEIVYEPTNNAEIAFAFREAGEYCGS